MAYLMIYTPHILLQFVSSGGLQLLLEIFNSGILEPKDQESWTVVRNPVLASPTCDLSYFITGVC